MSVWTRSADVNSVLAWLRLWSRCYNWPAQCSCMRAREFCFLVALKLHLFWRYKMWQVTWTYGRAFTSCMFCKDLCKCEKNEPFSFQLGSYIS